MTFKGIDYCELYEYFGIGPVPDSDEDAEELSVWLWKQMYVNEDGVMAWPPGVIPGCRKFLKELAKGSSHFTPVWKAVGKVDDDFSFMQLFTHLLPHMWN